jgi:hypothetical protein
MKNFAERVLLPAACGLVGLAGCSSGGSRIPAEQREARLSRALTDFVESLGCDEINDHVWQQGARLAVEFDSEASNGDDSILRRRIGEALVDRGRVSVGSRLFHRFSAGSSFKTESVATSEDREGQVYDNLVDLYRFFSKRVPESLAFSKLDAASRAKAVEALRDESIDSSPQYAALRGEFSRLLMNIKLDADQANIACRKPALSKPRLFRPDFVKRARQSWTKWLGGFLPNAHLLGEVESSSSTPTVDAGARKIFTGIYQSCEVLKLPAVPADYEISGVKILDERHADGRGAKRVIGDLEELLKTHYYVKDFQPGEACVDIREMPPIYDYGGKPYVRKAEPKKLDLLKDAGSGTDTRGIDCSGFVVSSLMASGLRLTRNQEMDAADYVTNTGANTFRSPQSNGLTCLATFKIKQVDKEVSTLQPGDIAASKGHIIIVEKVGKDPFKLANIDKASECVAGNFDVNDFDIQIIHSSPEAAGIGVARQKVSSFSSENYKSAFVELAVATCRAKFSEDKEYGSTTAAGINFVRHDLSKECREEPAEIVQSRCVESCWK